MNNKNILVTGGYGFIGSNFINTLIKDYDEFNLINLDNSSIGANKSNVNEPASEKQVIHHIDWDIADDIFRNQALESLPFDYLFHFAAESHVDRSISSPEGFVRSNVMGTMQILELAVKMGVKRVIMVSTDEVYGSMLVGSATETRKYNPSSVYSATKAAAELLCNAYSETHGLDIVTTRCANNFGHNQFEEKLIPKVIKNAIYDQKIPIYDKGLQKREWTHVSVHIRDLLFVAEHGKSGEAYNVGEGKSLSNIRLVKKILKALDKPQSLIEFIPNGRKGHDFRYAIDTSKLKALKSDHMSEDALKVLDLLNLNVFDRHLDETIEHYKNLDLSKDLG